VDGIHLSSGEYLSQGSDTPATGTPTGSYALYEGGVLTLNDFEGSGIRGFGDLKLNVQGTNRLTGQIVMENALAIEGTGSLVLDHLSRVAYACRSLRTDAAVAAEWARALGYELELFTARDAAGELIYHTNVVMSVGTHFAAVALDNIDAADRAHVADRLNASGRDVVAISNAEMCAFAGNMLEVGSWDEHLGDFRVLVMSRTARVGLAPRNFARLSAAVDTVLAVPIDVIERHGGGSVRCMLAEVFLP
jgi:hypothetical protein